jgi:RNA polymerase sigma-70 factor (ECF subfamily)
MPESLDPAGITLHAPNVFATTHWSVVLAARDDNTPAANEALERLCCTYWYPLYAYVRRRGYNAHDADDLTQSFFARLLEKDYFKRADRARGKFRTFLLTSLEHFLADEWDHSRRLKRGGSQAAISFDALTAEERYKLEPTDGFDPARLYDRRWATTLLDQALRRLESEHRDRNRADQFKLLRPFLVGEAEERSYQDSAQQLGMTVTALRMAASRLRERYRELLREEILQTVASEQEAEEEYRSLIAALRN